MAWDDIHFIGEPAKGSPPPQLGRNAGKRPPMPLGGKVKNSVLAMRIEDSGVTPLEFMINLMRSPCDLPKEPSENAPLDVLMAHDKQCEILLKEHRMLQFEAAKAAAPYVHPKLASIAVNANITLHEASIDELE